MVPVPPLPLAVAEPLPPKQVVFVTDVIITLRAVEGWVIVMLAVAEQLLASFT
jgi:hypothetical protein